MTALHYAFEYDARDIVRLLLNYGIEVSSADRQIFKGIETSIYRKPITTDELKPITTDELLQLVEEREQEKARVFTFIRGQHAMIPELWDIVMSYTKISGYAEHVRKEEEECA
jgi:hypothetical protein